MPDRGHRVVVLLIPQAKAQPPPPIAQAPKPARVMLMSVCPKGTFVSVSLMPLCSGTQVNLSNS